MRYFTAGCIILLAALASGAIGWWLNIEFPHTILLGIATGLPAGVVAGTIVVGGD